MKKLSLDALPFQKGEVLTRSQLKKVLGGAGSGEEGSDTDKPCNDPNECSTVDDICTRNNTQGTCKAFKCGTGKYETTIKYCMTGS